MPQLVGLLVIGAGVVAGYRLVTRLLAEQKAAAERAAHEAAGERVSEKDLGALVWDEVAQVYRPRR